MNSDNYVEIHVDYIHHTERAVLVAQDGEEIWIPRSLLSYSSDKKLDKSILKRGTEIQLEVREWFADKNCLQTYP